MDKKDFNIYIFQKDSQLIYSNFEYSDNITLLQLGTDVDVELTYDLNERTGEHLSEPAHYGTVAGLYYIWKNSETEFVGFSAENKLPNISMDQLLDILSLYHEEQVLMIEEIMPISMRKWYRDEYYYNDLKLTLSYLKKKERNLYDFTVENILDNNIRILPTIFMKRDIYNDFCAWLFPILNDLNDIIPTKKSVYQNNYLEHLSSFLLNVYVRYNNSALKEKVVITITTVYDGGRIIKPYYLSSIPIKDSTGNKNIVNDDIDTLSGLIRSGYIETVEAIISDKPSDYTGLKEYISKYNRQRMYMATTDYDNGIEYYGSDNIRSKSSPNPKRKKKVLFLLWDSINYKDVLEGLTEIGFDYETADIRGHLRRSPEYYDQFIELLKKDTYDIVLSTNYFDYLSEACYAVGIPYIAWTYDSPVEIGDYKYLGYDTTHLFCFDSEEAVFKSRFFNLSNIHYLPIAVNTRRYDQITHNISTSEEKNIIPMFRLLVDCIEAN